jgi:hypothetical protein
MARLGRTYPVQRVFTPPFRVPVGFNSVGAGAAASATTLSWSHTIGAGAAVVVAVSAEVSGSTFTATAKVGSTSMTQLGVLSNWHNASGFFDSVFLFGLIAGPSGAQTVSVTGSGSFLGAANSVSYFNVQSFGAALTNFNLSSSSATLSVTPSTVGQMAVQAFMAYTGTLTAYSQTSRSSQAFGSGVNEPLLLGDSAAIAPVFNATASSATWGAIGVPLLP